MVHILVQVVHVTVAIVTLPNVLLREHLQEVIVTLATHVAVLNRVLVVNLVLLIIVIIVLLRIIAITLQEVHPLIHQVVHVPLQEVATQPVGQQEVVEEDLLVAVEVEDKESIYQKSIKR